MLSPILFFPFASIFEGQAAAFHVQNKAVALYLSGEVGNASLLIRQPAGGRHVVFRDDAVVTLSKSGIDIGNVRNSDGRECIWHFAGKADIVHGDRVAVGGR